MSNNLSLQKVIQTRIEQQYVYIREIANDISDLTQTVPGEASNEDIDETLRYLNHSLSNTIDQLFLLNQQHAQCNKRSFLAIFISLIRGEAWRNSHR